MPEAVRTATLPPTVVQSQKLADGVWSIGGGSHNSLLVEYRDYLAIVDPQTFRSVDERYRGPALALIAARVDGTRLIDNASIVIG